MISFDLVQREKQALEKIRCRQEYSFSPLEKIDGSNSIIESIRQLQKSPLCFKSLMLDDVIQAKSVLESLLSLYEKCVDIWAPLRTVKGPPPFCLIWGLQDYPKPLPVYSRWGNTGTFPVDIRRQARNAYFEIKTTSRYCIEDTPSLELAEMVGLHCEPFQVQHAASLFGIACITVVLEEFEETLEEWEIAVKKVMPGSMPLAWLTHHYPERLINILAVYLVSPSNDPALITAMYRRVEGFMMRAESWVVLAEHAICNQNQIQIETKHSRYEAQVQTRAQVKAELSLKKSEDAKNGKRKPAIDIRIEKVANEFNKQRAGETTEKTYAELVERLEASLHVSPSSIGRDHAAAKSKGLLS